MIGSSTRRLGLLCAAGTCLILGILFYVHFFLSRPIGEGPAGPPVSVSGFQSIWTHQKVHLVGLGDSVTAGLGAKSADHTFFNRLLRNPDDEYPDMMGRSLSVVLPNLSSENLAVSGSTSQQHLDTVTEFLTEQPEDVYGLIVMTSGGNDLIHSYGRSAPRECAMYGATWEEAQPWIKAYGDRLLEIFATVDRNFPGGYEIYIGDIYDPTDGVGDAPSIYLPHWPDGLRIHAAYNEMLRTCAAKVPNVHVVPLHQTFLGHGSHCRQFWSSHYDSQDPTYWFYDNIEDPNDRGYDAIRRVFLNTILQHTQLKPSGAQTPLSGSPLAH